MTSSHHRWTASGLTMLLLSVSCSAVADDISTIRSKGDEWYHSPQGQNVLVNIITWQHPSGGWCKAYDVNTPRAGEWQVGQELGFDNGATWTETRVIARAYTLLRDERFRRAFESGLEYIFAAQLPGGGWPQRWPVSNEPYGTYITFNDDAMTEVMRLLLDIGIDPKPDFAFLDDAHRARAKAGFEKGLECTLDAQVRIGGELAVWCAQHDTLTLAPAGARSYELPSLSGGESAGILLMLMQVPQPSDRVKQSIHAGVRWFHRSKLTGLRLDRRQDADGNPEQYLVPDPAAPPLWARFYDLQTGQPFYCDRDGIKKPSLDQIGRERRNGYAWIREFGKPVMQAYPEWKRKHGE
jgi:PelA/Pel-15E family pectate lyase